MSRKNPVVPEGSQPRPIAEVYHCAWTDGDIETTIAFVADDVFYRAPGVDLYGKSEYKQLINGSTLRPTEPVDIAGSVDGNRVALFYSP